MIDWPKVVRDLEAENARLKKDLEQAQMALAIAYFDSVVEGKKQANALVAAAYSAAADITKEITEVLGDSPEHPLHIREKETADYIAKRIQSLTPADAEKALRELVRMAIARGFTEACEHGDMHNNQLGQIVNEVMEKNT